MRRKPGEAHCSPVVFSRLSGRSPARPFTALNRTARRLGGGGLGLLAAALSGATLSRRCADARAAGPRRLPRSSSPRPRSAQERSAARKGRGGKSAPSSSGRSEWRGGGSYTVCVRTCDGGFFPVTYSGAGSRADSLEEVCRSLCPNAEVELYAFPLGGTID